MFSKRWSDSNGLRIDKIAKHRPIKFVNVPDVNKALQTHSKYQRRGGLVGVDAPMVTSAVKIRLTSKESLMGIVGLLLAPFCSLVAKKST
jgi:hypothetical protein